jgi:hypothetical protein
MMTQAESASVSPDERLLDQERVAIKPRAENICVRGVSPTAQNIHAHGCNSRHVSAY